MKDLYKRIGFRNQEDSPEVIHRAILAWKSDTSFRRDCEGVLLNPERKAVYDRHRRVLVQIGQLRANLGLSRTALWLSSDCSDFDLPPSNTTSEIERLRHRARGSGDSTRPTSVDARQGASAPSHWGAGIIARVVGWVRDLVRFALDLTWYCVKVAAVLGLIGGGFYLISLFQDDPLRKEQPAAAKPVFKEPIMPLPQTGVMTSAFRTEAAAPLTIVTQKKGVAYYAKLVEWKTEHTVATMFIRDGKTLEILVPVGSYELRYCAGSTWYGPVHRFGPHPDTLCSRAEERFDFARTPDGYNGYTVELILQLHGNLQTKAIPFDRF